VGKQALASTKGRKVPIFGNKIPLPAILGESEAREIQVIRQAGIVVKNVSIHPFHDPDLLRRERTIYHHDAETQEDPEQQDNQVFCVGLAFLQIPPAGGQPLRRPWQSVKRFFNSRRSEFVFHQSHR
jgi:hypothetical protein